MIPGKKFDPATETSRRPTPETFAHLRGWTDVVLQHLKLAGIDEITNINDYLEQFTDLYIDNVISQVIAQIIGKHGDGFVTIEATEDGELKVQVAGGTAEIGSLAAGTEEIGSVGLLAGTEEIGSLGAGSELIGEVNVVGREHEVLQVAISGSYSGGVELIALHATKKIKITNIFLVVSGAVSLKFASGAGDLTGLMELGDTDEPRGIVSNFGAYPMETPINKNFQLNASGATNIMGYCNYYLE